MEFINLLDITVETSLLIILIGVINRLLKKRLDPNIRYFLWMFVVVRLLVPVRVILPVEVPERWETAAESVYSDQIVPIDEADAGPAANSWEEFPAQHMGIIVPLQLSGTVSRETAVYGQSSVSAHKIMYSVWALGVAAMAGYILLSNRRMFSELRKSRRKMKMLDNGIPLYDISGYNCLAGIVSPGIYVDTEALGSTENIRNVVSHELQHYRVRDNYWQFMRVFCLILQWHNPFMWWAYYASKRDCETACDARVVRNMTSEERYGYSASLLAAAESVCRKKQQTVLCSTPMGGGKSFMKKRLCDIMQYKYRRAVGLLICIICMIGLGCFVSLHLYADGNPDTAVKGGAAVSLIPGNQMEETQLVREDAAVPVSVNVADYYITNTGDFENLYYIDENNVLWGCGRNNCGQLGQGSQDYDFHEDMIKIAEHVVHVDYSQYDFMIYLTEDHKLYGVGNAGCGALQQYDEFDLTKYINGEHYTVTTPCLLMENVVYARCGRSDVACLTEDSEIWIFGTVGADGKQICYYPYPTKVLEDAAFVTGGFFSHAALLKDGSVWTWGYNYAGACGVSGGGIVPEPIKAAENVRMVWTGGTEYNVDCYDISEFGGFKKRGMENTIIETGDGEYLICGARVGTEEKVLPIYYETSNYALVCTHEFRPIEEYQPYEE